MCIWFDGTPLATTPLYVIPHLFCVRLSVKLLKYRYHKCIISCIGLVLRLLTKCDKNGVNCVACHYKNKRIHVDQTILIPCPNLIKEISYHINIDHQLQLASRRKLTKCLDFISYDVKALIQRKTICNIQF